MNNQLLHEVNKKLDLFLGLNQPVKEKKKSSRQQRIEEMEMEIELKHLRKNLKLK